jgi:hypothetical protein
VLNPAISAICAEYGLARFRGYASFDQLVLPRGDLRDEGLDDRMERLVLPALEDGPDQRHEIDYRIRERSHGSVVSVLQCQGDDPFRVQPANNTITMIIKRTGD